MQLLRRIRSQVGLATILMVSVWITYVTPIAQAEDNKPTINAEWKDPSSGSTYYNWSGSDGDKYSNKVIVSTNDGKWARLSEKFRSIYMDPYVSPNPMLNINSGNATEGDLFDYLLPLYLDTTNNVAVRGQVYRISPDEKWGLYQTLDFGAEMSSDGKTAQNTQLHSYFIKNMTTGQIQEWKSSTQYATVYWLPDSKLLVAHYSEVANQKEISTFDPATGKTKQLVFGKLYQYSDQEQKLVYVKNEPKRLQWIYDLKTGKSSLLTKTEEEKLYSWKDPCPTTKAPDKLDIKTLPVIDLPIRNLYEYEVVTSHGSELVPYAFVTEGKTYIPLRPIVSKFKLSVGQREGDMYNYKYKLTGPTGQIVTLDRTNSRVFQFRLLVTPEVLEKVGLQGVTVKPLIPAVIK
ncbi:hypothetical protein [Paenibacillus glacialis]|uniref:Uncharacterized protein n=1 Tax=Paenibacillus glacialis TaxID=494026 RepID=A0A168NUL8_9BACL|nr:hypothetical protein [Paenibacillus glacialis]OAB46123.1 hypothetical protein PGLA_01650 [Paenibacillus glacialis]